MGLSVSTSTTENIPEDVLPEFSDLTPAGAAIETSKPYEMPPKRVSASVPESLQADIEAALERSRNPTTPVHPDPKEAAKTSTDKKETPDPKETERLTALVEGLNPDLAPIFDALGFRRMQFAFFRTKTESHTFPIIGFKVLYHNKHTGKCIQKAPIECISQLKTVTKMKSSKLFRAEEKEKAQKNEKKVFNETIDKKEQYVSNALLLENEKFKKNSETLKDASILKSQDLPVKPTDKIISILPKIKDYAPVFCAVLKDRKNNVEYLIQSDALRRADVTGVAELFMAAYRPDCRPPGWTLGLPSFKEADLERYIEPLEKDLTQTFGDLRSQLRPYAVDAGRWVDLAKRVYLVGIDLNAEYALSRRLPCKDPVMADLKMFGYEKSGFLEAPSLLAPIAVYVRTPYIGETNHTTIKQLLDEKQRSEEAQNAEMASADASLKTEKAQQIAAQDIQLKRTNLLKALVPPVFEIDVVNVSGPVFEMGSREYNAVMELAQENRKNWIRQRLAHCFELIFFVAKNENKSVVVVEELGSAPNFGDFNLIDCTYNEQVEIVGQQMAKEAEIRLIKKILDDDAESVLYVNDMGPEYVVGGCNFKDATPNGRFGSRTAMAFLTVPAINTRIQVKTIAPKEGRVFVEPEKASTEVFSVPPNGVADYVVEKQPTLKELAIVGDKRVRDGYVPCGAILEHDKLFYQSFVRMEVDYKSLWSEFMQSGHKIKPKAVTKQTK